MLTYELQLLVRAFFAFQRNLDPAKVMGILEGLNLYRRTMGYYCAAFYLDGDRRVQ